MANEKQLTVGRRYLVDDPQRPIELRYEGQAQAFVFRYVDWYSRDFSDPYLRIRRGNDAALEKFQPIGEAWEDAAGAVVGDMLCFLQLHLELSVGAKGIMLMQSAGLKLPPDPEIKAKLNELKYLEKSLGKTGLLAIKPLLRLSRRELWQLYMLDRVSS